MSHPANNMCFVLMPFTKEFKNQWELAFSPAIKETGLTPWRGDDENLGTNIIMRDITKCIYDAEIIIADLTGRNPNVMYELGLAHAAKKSVIMLAQSDEDVPFDIRHIRYLKYDARDLSSLKRELIERLKSTISMHGKDQPDFFPELKMMGRRDADELEYLRQKASVITVTVEPEIADVFFNDKLMGNSPIKLRINNSIERNTISVAAPGFFEYHEDIKPEEISAGSIRIPLETRFKSSVLEKRVPRWLRFRRRDPNNPVLMRAISQYLESVDEVDESLAEVEELLKVAPEWYLAHNQAGCVKASREPEVAISHFKKTVMLNPRNYIGYYNLACEYAINKEYDKCLSKLQHILDNPTLLHSFSQVNDDSDILHDEDFEKIKEDPEYSSKFRSVADMLMESRQKNA